MDKFKKNLLFFFKSMVWVGVLGIIIDVITKQVMQSVLVYQGNTITVIPGFLSLTLLYNNGAGFGLFGDIENVILRRTILIGISVIMSAAFVFFYIWKFKKLNTAYKLTLNLLFAGAFGNLIDRAFYPDGKVIDFINVDIGSYKDFPIFNIADSLLVIGVIIMIILVVIDEIKEFKTGKAMGDKSPSINEESLNSIENTAKNEMKEEEKTQTTNNVDQDIPSTEEKNNEKDN